MTIKSTRFWFQELYTPHVRSCPEISSSKDDLRRGERPECSYRGYNPQQ